MKRTAPGELRTRPGILVDRAGRWRFQGAEIDNVEVLRYFKAQLRRDAQGYWIDNRFGELRERGDLDAVEAYPLHAIVCHPLIENGQLQLMLRLDSGEELQVPAANAAMTAEDCIVVEIPQRGFAVRLSGMAMASLVENLYLDEHGAYYLVAPGAAIKLPLAVRADSEFLQPAAPPGKS
ncbi:MAG: hypothetical protein K1X75_04565 [Leptospirales bacterium]|nr:hypothetical protein [Leptospirales bacterium]